MKSPEEWAKRWCICEAYWAKYVKTDPRCRHEEIEEIVERVQAEALEEAAKLADEIGVTGSGGDAAIHIRALKEATP